MTIILALVLLASAQALPPPVQPSLLKEIRRVPDGLLLVGVTASGASLEKEPTIEGVRRVVVNLPETELGPVPAEPNIVDPVILWIRCVRYRSENESGVRLRVDLRGYPLVSLEPVAEGLLLRVVEPVKTTPALVPAVASRPVSPPGIFSFWGNGTSTSSSGSQSTSFSGDVSAGQVIPNLFSAEARLIYGESDGAQTLLRYTGILRGFDLGWGAATAGGGDLLIRFGGVGGFATTVAESLDMRGVGLRLTTNNKFALELFEGSARGAPLLIPVGESLTINSEFSGDHVYGGFFSAPLWATGLRLGAGWAHTVSATPGFDRDNRFLEVGWEPSSLFEIAVRGGDVSGTRADGSRLTGTLFGAQARLQTAYIDFDGTYRHQDAGYVAPGGDQEFPGEKGSLLTASARPAKGLQLLASVSESEAFPFQAPDQGPLSSHGRTAAAAYTSDRGTSVTANFSDLSQKSIGQAANPVDSETLGGGLTVAQRVFAGSVTTGVSEERTKNRLNPLLDLDEQVANLNLTYGVGSVGAILSGRYAIAKQVQTGERLPDYGGDFSLNGGLGRTSGNVGVFVDRSPAGVALFSSTRKGVRAGFTTVLPRDFYLSATANYVEVDLGRGSHFLSRFYSVNLRKILNWGAGSVPGEAGVWDSGEVVSPVLAKGIVSGRVFLDVNGNGRPDPGEPGVAGVVIQTENVVAVTDSEGRYRLVVEPGRHLVRLITTRIRFAYQLGDADSFVVEVSARRHIEKNLPLIGFGNFEGRLEVKSAEPRPEDRRVVAFIGLRLEGNGLRRETLAGSDGEFRFANLPPGSYELVIDESDIDESYALEGPAVREVRVEVGRTGSLIVPLRRLTTRERLERRHEEN